MGTVDTAAPIARHLPEIIGRARASWLTLKGGSVFVTGGTGLFGRWLLECMVAANRELDLDLRVHVLSRRPDAFAQLAPHLAQATELTLLRGDVTTFEFPDHRFTHFVCGAATSARETFEGEDPLRKFDTLVNGTRRVLEMAAQNPGCRLLFLSSGVAYGPPPASASRLREDDFTAPDTIDADTALGQGKRAAEFLCAHYARRHAMHCTVARCFSFVGPFLPLDLHYAIGNFIRQALWEDAIVVNGDGTPLRSYLYLGDLVVWLVRMLDRSESSRLYNVGSDEPISIRDLAFLVRDVVAPEKPVRILGAPAYSVGNAVRDRYVPDISRARVELGLDVWTPLGEAIRLTAAHAMAASGDGDR